MKRPHVFRLLALALAIALAVWIARNTYWGAEQLDMPLKGEAARNPFYAAQHFAALLGARASWDHGLESVPGNAVIVLSDWNWGLSERRRRQMEDWVQAGGRLVVDRELLDNSDAFTRWSGIYRDELPEDNADLKSGVVRDNCRSLVPAAAAAATGVNGPTAARNYMLCGIYGRYSLRSSRPATWILRNESASHVLRVAHGRGSVTAVNATPFLYRGMLQGDHAALFVAVTQLQRDDEVHFISDEDHASLLMLAWRYGAPVMAMLLLLVVLLVWRSTPRFGPLLSPPERARRSLAEQILGSGRFILSLGGGAALHGAAVRALGTAAGRHIAGYERLGSAAKIAALARASGYGSEELHAAVHFAGTPRGHALGNALLLLEAARRRILIATVSNHHGR
jgi:hypothetical protein